MCLAVSGASSAQTTFGTSTGRPVTVTLPRNFSRSKKYALGFFLHPLGGNGVDVAIKYFGGTGVERAANSGGGMIVVTPSGTLNGSSLPFWDASDPCCRLGFGSPVNDQGYLCGLAEEIIAALPVDRKRVGAFGYSNGAFMASTLGACRPDLFTHVFAIAGMRSLPADAHLLNVAPFFCNPGVATPVYYTGIHGTADTTVNYNGDPTGLDVADVPSGIYLSAQASAEAWGVANGCSGTFASYTTNTTFIQGGGTTTTLFRYPSQAAGGDVEFASLAGIGHNPNTAEEFFRYVHARFWSMPRP
jgi:poly(3-hydroxybutyrate) depolymerase